MAILLRDKIKQLPEEQQQIIANRTAELLEEFKREQLRQLFLITRQQTGQVVIPPKQVQRVGRVGYYTTTKENKLGYGQNKENLLGYRQKEENLLDYRQNKERKSFLKIN